MPKLTAKKLREKLAGVDLIAMDVDGVLTDGRIIISSDGSESKNFNVRDGHGLSVARFKGFKLAWISGRVSEATTLRARELGIEHVFQGHRRKDEILEELAEKLGVALDKVLFMGDDVVDIPAMKAAGIGVAVADAHPQVLAEADWVTSNAGGEGAVREIIDLIVEAGA